MYSQKAINFGLELLSHAVKNKSLMLPTVSISNTPEEVSLFKEATQYLFSLGYVRMDGRTVWVTYHGIRSVNPMLMTDEMIKTRMQELLECASEKNGILPVSFFTMNEKDAFIRELERAACSHAISMGLAELNDYGSLVLIREKGREEVSLGFPSQFTYQVIV